MNEELKKLRQSVSVLKAQMSYMRESTQKVEKAVEDVSIDLDAFIDVFSQYQERIDKRLDRLEKHVGF